MAEVIIWDQGVAYDLSGILVPDFAIRVTWAIRTGLAASVRGPALGRLVNVSQHFLPRMLLACGLLAAPPAMADIPAGIPTLHGTLVTVDSGSRALRVRKSDGSEEAAILARDAAIVIGETLPRAMMRVGETVSVDADDIQLPEGRLLVAGIYLQADPSVPPGERERLTREFLPASGHYRAPDTSSHTVISGRLLAVEATSVVIESGGETVRVKISPEASGESVRPGQLCDLHPGYAVTMALREGGVRAILVTK